MGGGSGCVMEALDAVEAVDAVEAPAALAALAAPTTLAAPTVAAKGLSRFLRTGGPLDAGPDLAMFGIAPSLPGDRSRQGRLRYGVSSLALP